MRRLIVNADGFGLTNGINKAIFEVLERGFVRSVSINSTFKAVDDVKQLQQNFPEVTLGIHFNLSVGSPLLSPKTIPSLLNGNGEFFGDNFETKIRSGVFKNNHIKQELTAQIEILLAKGIHITHWDSHQNRHLYSGFFESAIEVANEFKLKYSRPFDYFLIVPSGFRLLHCADYYMNHPKQTITHLIAAWRTHQIRSKGFSVPNKRIILNSLGPNSVHNSTAFHRMFATLPNGVSFLEVHPGYPDTELKNITTMLESRNKERLLLVQPNWLTDAKNNGIDIVSYQDAWL
jgi:predicted glycoside hydrolase/deacetylase ChbG (UPF0249 family)